jgi:hypothetical protein
MSKTNFIARASREGRWWVVEVDGVGVTQARSLTEAQEMATDLVVAMRGLRRRQVAVTVEVNIPPDLRRQVDEARAAISDLDQRQREAARMSRRVAQHLVRTEGLTGRDASVILGVSPQRVSQLLSD